MPLTFTEADFADTDAESQGKGLKFTEADFAEPAAAPDIGAFLPRWKSPTLNLEQGPQPAPATIPSAMAGPSPVEPLDPFEDLMRPATSYLPPGAHKALRTGLQYATTPELKLVELASELTGAKKTGEITKGIEDSITDLEEFFTSPVGAASLFAGGLTAAGQKAVALAFATKMATDVPEIATQLGAEIGKPEDERDYRKIAQLASEGAQAVGFAGLGGAHVAGRPLAGKLGAYPTSAPVTIPGIREARIGQYPEPIGPQPPLASPDEQPIIPNPSLPSRAKKVRVEVPEAGEPPSGLNVIQEIRQNNLRTAPSIQEHFRRTGGRVPDNEEAAQLRDQAFPEDVTERLISEGEGRQRVVNELNALNRLPNKRAADWKRIGQLEEQLRGVTRQPPDEPPPPDEGGTPVPKPPTPPIQPKGPSAIQQLTPQEYLKESKGATTRDKNKFQTGTQNEPGISEETGSISKTILRDIRSSIAWLKAISRNDQEAISNAENELFGESGKSKTREQGVLDDPDTKRIQIRAPGDYGARAESEPPGQRTRPSHQRQRIRQSSGKPSRDVGLRASETPLPKTHEVVEALRLLRSMPGSEAQALGARTLQSLLAADIQIEEKESIINAIKDYALQNRPPSPLFSPVPAQPVQGQGQVPAPQGAQGIRRGPPPEPPQAQPPVLKPTPLPYAAVPGEPELLGRPVSAWKQIATAQRIALLDPANQTRLANSLGLPLDQRTPHQIATRLKQRIAEVEAAAAAKAKPAEPSKPEVIVERQPDGIRVSGITVPPSERGKGVGTQLMREIIAESESTGKPIYLTASAEPGRQADLNRFYERLGFEHWKDDPLSGSPMYRRIPKAKPVSPTESAADLQQELDTELEQEPTVAAPTPAAPVKPTPPETPTTEPAPTTPQAPKPQTPLERLKALEASIKKEQEAAVAALTPTEPAPTAAPVAPAATPTEPTPTAPTPEPPSAKPLTKTQQAAHQSATRNADFLIGVAEKYSSATLPQRLKGKVEGAMIAMRNAAAKLGMEVPSQGMWFSPETNAELARNVKDKLEGIKPETKPTGTQPPIEERGPQGGNISTFGLLDPAWLKPILKGAGATIRDTVGSLYGPSDAPMPERMRGFLGGVAGQTFPRTTNAHRTTGEKGAKFISSRSAGAIQGTAFAHDVLDGTGADNLQVGAAVMEGNFRSVKRGFTDAAAEAQRRGDTAEAARLALESRKVATAVGQGSIWPNEAAYQAYLQSPEFRAAAPKYARLWTSDVDPIFRRAADIDPTENLETRGEQHGLRANLNWARVDPAEPGRTGVFIRDADGVLRPSNIVAPNAPSGASRRGVLSNVLHRKSPFARRATGQAEAYILDLTSAMQNTFGRQLEIANRKFFDDALVENGHAVIGRPGEIHELHGEPTRAFEIKRTTIVRETDGTTRRIPVNQNIYVRESLAPEYEAGLNIASLGPNSTKLAKINKGLNTLVLSGFTDAAIHGTNQAMTMLGSPGTMQGYFKELIASGFMRADFIPTIGRMVQKTLHENSKQMLKLAEMSAWREGVPDPHYMEWGRNLKPAQLANPMNWSRGFIHWLDGAGRLVLDDMFTNLTKTYSHIPDTPTNRREFVNRLGQYMERAQGPIIRFLRGINAAPFVTAGRQMSLNTARLATFQPGLQTGSLWTRGQLMTISAAKLVGTVLFAGAAGYALTGQFGKPGEIILPTRDREGRRLRINVFELLGYGRGWRGTGMRAVAQGIIQRQPLGMIVDNASKDIGNAWTRPFVGPPLQFEEIARTGQPFGFGQRGYLSRPGRTGIGQFGENVKAAALHTVPLASTVAEGLRPGTTPLDIAQKQFPRIVPTPERNALSQIRELGRVYKQREGIGYAPRSLERSIYEPLQSALAQNNAPLIRDEVQRLLAQEKTPEKKEKRLKEIQSELWPFARTGNLHLKAQGVDLDHEADFYNSLKPQEQLLYQQALKDKVRSYGRLLLALGVKDARYPPVQDAYKWVLQP